MADQVVYDEPTAQRHRVAGFAGFPHPDPRIHDIDRRVVRARCGMVIALVGLQQHRPAVLTSCAGCFDAD